MSAVPPITFVLKPYFCAVDRPGSYFVEQEYCVLHTNERDGRKNVHECFAHNVGSPHAKFERETVDLDKNQFRVKCCYNNKYWSCTSEGFIAASESSAEKAILIEFEPDGVKFRLKCPQLQTYVCINFDDSTPMVKSETRNESLSPDEFRVIDWESLLILPKEVAFKADNGNYISVGYSPSEEYQTYLRAMCTDIGEASVGNQIEFLSDQKIAIKNTHWRKYWTYDDYYYRVIHKNEIYMNASSNDCQNAKSQFCVIKMDRDFIALRNVDKGFYCFRSKPMYHGEWLLLNPDKRATISKQSQLCIEELVLSREIYDVDFDFDQSYIYNEGPHEGPHDETTNRLPDEETIGELKLECKEAMTSSYDTASSVRTINQFSFEATVPIIEDKLSFTPKFEYQTEEEKKTAWGESKTTTFELSCLIKVTKKPKTRVLAKMESTKANAIIPFSYTQRDLLPSGEHVLQTKDDGIYTCESYFDFNIRILEEKLA